ncbi:preprotein translocase subunit YajC [Lacticaseibacillus saniviri]|nr:preprotein translocase subunit YajC [Lacticaseibacillus saniviri]
MSMIILLVVMGGFMYFSMIRPQRKQQEQRKQMLNAMKKGDAIVTIGGLHGKIDEINEDKQTVVIDADGIFLTFNLSAIRTVDNGAATTPVAAAKPVDAPAASAAPEKDAPAADDKPYTEPTSNDDK